MKTKLDHSNPSHMQKLRNAWVREQQLKSCAVWGKTASGRSRLVHRVLWSITGTFLYLFARTTTNQL